MNAPGTSIFQRVEVAAILSFGILLCFTGLFYGLPQLLDPDELYYVGGAVRMLQPPYWDPDWYGPPASTVMDLLAPLFALYEYLGHPSGTLASIAESYGRDSHQFVLIGRVAGMAIYAAFGICFYVYVRAFMPRLPAAAALLALILSPEVLALSQVVRMDVLLALFLVLAFHFANKILDQDRLRDYLLAGFALGAAVVTKYPGVIGCVYIVLAAVCAWRRHEGIFARTYLFLIVAAVSSLASAFLFGPYLFIDFKEMLADVSYETKSRHLSATSGGLLDSFAFYFGTGFPALSGFLAYVIGILGICTALVTRRRTEVWLLAAFFIAYLAFLLLMPLHWVRYALPLAPVFAAGVGLAAEEIWTRTPPAWRRGALAALLTVALLPSLAESLRTTYLKATDKDTRIEAMAWVLDNIPAGSVVALEPYAPQVTTNRYTLLIPQEGRLRPLAEVWPHRIRPMPSYQSFGRALHGEAEDRMFPPEIAYVITSNFPDRYRMEVETHPEEVAVYDHIESEFHEVKQFQGNFWKLGPKVTVHARPELAAKRPD